MDTTCLGGRRNKQKPQKLLEQSKTKQEPKENSHHHHHYYYYQHKDQEQNYPKIYMSQEQNNTNQNHQRKDISQKSTLAVERQPGQKEKQENFIQTMHPLSSYRNSGNSGNGSNSSNHPSNTNLPALSAQQQQQQQQKYKLNINPNFPPPPDYPPPPQIGMTSKQTSPSSSSPKITAISTSTIITPTTDLACSMGMSNASTFTNNSAEGNNDNFSELVTPIGGLAMAKNQRMSGNSSSNKNQHSTQQQRYPILDLDAIEICNEPEPRIPQQTSLLKSFRSKKSSMNSSNSNRNFNYNYNNMGTCESNSSSQSSNSNVYGDGNNVATLEANVKWSHNVMPSEITLVPGGFIGGNEIDICNDVNIPLHHPHPFHHDYSYAYYEPGAAMRHSNIPAPELQPVAVTSRPPPPNSIRALLSKGKKNKILVSPSMRQSYQTKLAGNLHENFYEEIESSSRSGSHKSSHSSGSLSNSVVEEEFRRVQSHHRKILGELNLSVEAMLMPETPPNVSPTEKQLSPAQSAEMISSNSSHSLDSALRNKIKSNHNSLDNLNELLNTVGPTDDLLSPMCNSIPNTISFCASSNTCTISGSSTTCTANTDLDSGFSGSSGASYIGSLRYHKTNAALSNLMTSRKLMLPGSSSGSNNNSSGKKLQNEKQCSVSFSENNFNTNNENLIDISDLNSSCRSSQRSQNTWKSDSGSNSAFIVRSSYGKKVLDFSKLNAPEEPAVKTTPTESKARSFWAKKGWKKVPGFASTSSINQTGIGK